MLRTLFVLGIVAAGGVLALGSPFNALLFYVWNAYFRPEAWVWDAQADFVRGLNLSYAAGLLVVIYSIATGRRFRFNFHIGLLFLFLLHTLLSALLAEHPDYAWRYWRDFLKTITITYLIVVLADDPRRLRLLVLAMGLSLGFEGAKQGWAQLFQNPGGMNLNPNPFLGDNNGVGVGMLMLAPLFGALAQTTTRKWPKRLYHFVLIGVVYRAISTYSRGAFLACGALAVVYWVRSKNKLGLLVGMLIVAGIVLPVMPDEFWERMQTIQTYQQVEEGSALSRLHFWKVAGVMANRNPLLGVGYFCFNPSYDAYDFSFGGYGSGRSVHSSWFGVLGELGYVGLALYVPIFALAFRNCRRARKLAAANPALEGLGKFAASLEASLAVFVVGGTFLPFQYNEMLFHMVGLSIALACVAEQAGAPWPEWRPEAPEPEPLASHAGAGP